METVRVNTPGHGYDVLIGRGLLGTLGDALRAVTGPCRVCVVTDDTVNALYGERAVSSLAGAGFETSVFSFPAGEGSKTLDVFSDIQSFLFGRGLTRSDFIVALGGGIPGDMGGFAAACYQRGVRFVQVPTTLLAAVDSSVGGKTAVNLPGGKNLVGAFHQPSLVVCDPDCLDTLPDSVFADGMAEVVKYGVIRDADFFAFLETCDIKANIGTIIRRCVEIKAEVVSADERETGVRAILNYGHTLAHAIEKCSGFTVPHGRAVGIGMYLESKALAALGLAQDYTGRLEALLERLGLDTATVFDADALCRAAAGDKKRTDKGIKRVVADRIGHSCVDEISLDELSRMIGAALA